MKENRKPREGLGALLPADPWAGRAVSLVVRVLPAVLLLLAARGQARAQQFLQYGFESREPIWVQGTSDASFKETQHRLTEETAHTGQRCEVIQLEADKGTFIYYTYSVGRAPVGEELNVSLWVKANRPGIQLLCRVVLPRERDPRSLDQPLTTLLQGDTYKLVGRWQQLTLREPPKRLREQQLLLQAERKANIQTADAYIDQLLLNVHAGPGMTEVHLDDLEVGPVFDAARPPIATAPPSEGTPRPLPTARARNDQVQLKGNPSQLLVRGEKFFLRGIRHTGTPLKTLYDAGFNTIWVDEEAAAGLVEDALNIGFWVVPSVRSPEIAAVPGTTPEGGDPGDGRGVPAQLTSRSVFGRKVSRFLDHGGILCWDLGSNLVQEQMNAVVRTSRALHSADPMRPVSVNVWDGFQRYSRNVDHLMLGIHRWPLMTGMSMTGYRDWLVGRRRLAQPGTYTWTWVQTHLPEWFLDVGYDGQRVDPRTELLGPQPEQISLLACTAIGSGFRGLGFWSDRFLADSHSGRDRLLALALLNHELHMLEPMLVSAEEPFWIDTKSPQVKAAVLRTPEAMLVMPVWLGHGAQMVPGQAATADLKIVVPQVPPGWLPWEVTPGRVRSLTWNRVPGGVEVTIREFGLHTAVVFTSDLRAQGPVVRFQDLQRRMRGAASQWAHSLAEEELTKVEQVHQQLEQMGQSIPDSTALLGRARTYISQSAQERREGKYEEAYADAQRALRPLRILMRSHWERATSRLTSATGSPYAVSFYTLPRHYRFWEEVVQTRVAANVLPGGDFELPPSQVPKGWIVQEAPSLDEVQTRVQRVAALARGGRQSLLLEVKPKDPLNRPQVLERTFVALHSPAVRLEPGSLVRVSAWVYVPGPVTASPDGVLLYDSAGGEPLAVRLTEATGGWKQYVFYRRVPREGKIHVTAALTGLGAAYFDDIRIEPLLPSGETASAPVIQQTGYPRP